MLGLRVQRHFISNMSNAVPVFFDGLKTAGSYTSGQVATDGSDVRALALLTMLAVFEAVQLRGGAQLALVASAAALLGVLLWAALRSESYRRYRTAITAAVRLVCAAKVLAAESFRLFDGAPEGASLSKAAPHFVMLLAWESGALLLSQAAWSLELPPLLSAAVQLAGVVAVSFRNPSTCTATYMTQPLNTRLLGRLYRVLQPAVAPLEPLLAALGVDRANTAGRQCICVLTVLQFWGALVLPLLLTTRRQLLKYLDWKRQRLGQQRAQRRQQRRAGRAAHAGGAGSGGGGAAAGGSSKSSPESVTTGGTGGTVPINSNSDSGRSSSLSSDSLDEVPARYGDPPPRLSLGQLLKPARRGGKPHPEDWQYECAARLMADLHASWLQLALLAVGLTQMYAWHVTLFPALAA